MTPARRAPGRSPGAERASAERASAERGAGRRIAILLSAVAMLVASAVGSGALGGTPIDEAAGGALAADATPVAPAGPAFTIWSVIYTGLLSLAVWQALPAQRRHARLRRLDGLLTASLLLNGAWILSVQRGWLGVSVLLIVALLAVLTALFVGCVRTPANGRLEALLLDGTTGLYLGWVSVATVANVTAWLAASGVGSPGPVATASAVAVLGVAGLVGVALARFGAGRISVALAIVWGLAWVAVGRLAGDLVSVPAAAAAGAAAAAVAVATVRYRRRGLRADVGAAG